MFGYCEEPMSNGCGNHAVAQEEIRGLSKKWWQSTQTDENVVEGWLKQTQAFDPEDLFVSPEKPKIIGQLF